MISPKKAEDLLESEVENEKAERASILNQLEEFKSRGNSFIVGQLKDTEKIVGVQIKPRLFEVLLRISQISSPPAFLSMSPDATSAWRHSRNQASGKPGVVQAEVELANGKSVKEVCRGLGAGAGPLAARP